jgi:hypothetical protein
MTNDGDGEIRMTKLEGMMKIRKPGAAIRLSFRPTFIRHQESRFDPSENLVCFLQRLFASDIEPLALDLERFHGFSRV